MWERKFEKKGNMKTVMIVDDDEDVRKSVKLILEKNNYEVIMAVSGDDCLKKLKNVKPDLILLDIMMPGTPTPEVIKMIKNTKVIIFSVIRTSELEKGRLMKQSNVVDFIQKPFDLNTLLSKVKKTLGD